MMQRYVTPAAFWVLSGAAAAGALAQAPGGQPPASPTPIGQPSPQQFDVRGFVTQFDRNRDGSLDVNEVPQDLRPAFGQIDVNRDGRLSAAELQQFFARNPPQPPPPPLAEIVIDTALDAAQDANELADLQRSYELLRVIDANNDGRITAEEARAAKPRLIERRADAVIRGFDTNNDGRVSRQEAKGQLAQDFDRLDTNRDGFVDKAEMARALTAQLPAAPAATGAPAQPQRPAAPPPPPAGR
jgi:Ca2+-binding EF-hand superfamily protein